MSETPEEIITETSMDTIIYDASREDPEKLFVKNKTKIKKDREEGRRRERGRNFHVFQAKRTHFFSSNSPYKTHF